MTTAAHRAVQPPLAGPAVTRRARSRPSRLRAIVTAVAAATSTIALAQSAADARPPGSAPSTPAVASPATPVNTPAQPAPREAFPSWQELEAQGARIGRVEVIADDIFDLKDPKESYALYRAANALHIQTRPQVIRHALLFQSGDRVSASVIDETERLLRRNTYLHDVQIRPIAYRDGVVDIEVRTRDTWSLDFGVNFGRSGGANSSRVRLKEYNLLGLGIGLSYGRSNTVDRSSNTFQIAADRVGGSWVSAGYLVSNNDDGRTQAISLVRPFYSLDARWSGGFTASKDDRIDTVYDAGRPVSAYRRGEQRVEAFYGWSSGRVNGWVHRTSVGLRLADDTFAAEPGRTAPAGLPADRQRRAPFVRYELIEDRFERTSNRNLMGRPEFFQIGLNARVELGWAAKSLGSTEDALQYAASVSRGFRPRDHITVMTEAWLSGEFSQGQVQRHRIGGQVEAYVPQGPRWLLYGSLSGERLSRPDPAEALTLGGDNGLRGFPLRYQQGEHRVLATVEERYFTDMYWWRLIRVGVAGFIDVGRAWESGQPTAARSGWLADAGFGLRFVNTRSAYSNVLHVDIAVPLNAGNDVKKWQLLVKTKTSF